MVLLAVRASSSSAIQAPKYFLAVLSQHLAETSFTHLLHREALHPVLHRQQLNILLSLAAVAVVVHILEQVAAVAQAALKLRPGWPLLLDQQLQSQWVAAAMVVQAPIPAVQAPMGLTLFSVVLHQRAVAAVVRVKDKVVLATVQAVVQAVAAAGVLRAQVDRELLDKVARVELAFSHLHHLILTLLAAVAAHLRQAAVLRQLILRRVLVVMAQPQAFLVRL
jgi:hypothetical protein